MKERMPYEIKHHNGFIENKLLKKPKVRGGIIYSAVNHRCIHGGRFLPTWDGTDHFHFVCAKCKGVADVLAVKFCTDYGGGVKYALFFYLGCRKCGATGQRKIYLDRRPDACMFQIAFDGENVYYYREADEPYTVITLKEKTVKFLRVLKEQKQVKTIDEALNALQAKL
ncbi:hypothetical protein DRO54_09280 [Candidatus Bathyarchaeota archaeon]|nr:MAG: hypothetical protein DRO54_09280 [Candidatus Bathyarchaeota archaeon]